MDLVATGTIKHNGKWFNTGDQIKKVKKEDGERLIEQGVAKIDEVSQEVAQRMREEEEAKKKAEEAARKKAEAEQNKDPEKK